MKKRFSNNKGFSLVELIIVVAIMAILIGILAPQYMKYVEKSRVSADNDTVDSVRKACETAMADPNSNISQGFTVTFSTTEAATFSDNTAKTEVEAIIGQNPNTQLKSKTYASSAPVITVNMNTVNGVIEPEVTVSGLQGTTNNNNNNNNNNNGGGGN